MDRISLNHWYLHGNELSISLMRFHVKINILKESQNLYFQLTIMDEDYKESIINFNSIEDAISFTEKNNK